MKRILAFDDERLNIRLYQVNVVNTDFEISPYLLLDDAMKELVTNHNNYDFAVFDWRIAGDPVHKDTTDLIVEAIKLGLPVMVRTADDSGAWIDEALHRIESGVGREISKDDVQFYAVDGNRKTKIEHFVEDLKEFSSNHISHKTPEEER